MAPAITVERMTSLSTNVNWVAQVKIPQRTKCIFLILYLNFVIYMEEILLQF